jgi:hypothetical protein
MSGASFDSRKPFASRTFEKTVVERQASSTRIVDRPSGMSRQGDVTGRSSLGPESVG